jgi:hypothetical protein
VKVSFYEESEHVFNKFPKYYKHILLGDFNAEVGTEDILNRQLGVSIYTKLAVIMQLEQKTLPHTKI